MSYAANTISLGFVPFLGYHHVLMILIAIAIILLCEYFAVFNSNMRHILTDISSPTCRLFILFTTHS